jgi:carboxymethylenebutenolidase
MACLDVQIPAADGHSNGTLHLSEGAGPWPGVLVFPDAAGARETFRRLGDRLAGPPLAASYQRAGAGSGQ